MQVRSPVVVGRQRELAIGQRLLDDATHRRQGSTALVTGEAGIGKSRLLAEIAERARQHGVEVFSGRGVPDGAAVAYRPLAELLAPVTRRRDLADVPDLAPWRPALRVMLPTPGADDVDPTDATAHLCGEALIRALGHAARDRPRVILLDDLHWSDPDTLDVLDYLADNIATEPTLLVGALRDDSTSAALDLTRRMVQRGTATGIPLTGLSDEAITEMTQACFPDATTDAVARVRARSDGVPLFVEELLATPGVPASISEAVRTRTAELSEDDRAVLYAAAVLGREFDWELIPQITGHGLGQVTGALERMVDQMLISITPDGGFRFRHALTRDAVVAMLVPPRRTLIARAALSALDTLRPGAEDADLAIQAGENARAGAALTASGKVSLRRGALGTAVQTLRRATGLLDDPTDARFALIEALALAGRSDEALEVGQQLLDQLQPDDPAVAEVHLTLASAAVSSTRWPDAASHLDKARAGLPADPAVSSRARADLLEAEIALNDDDVARARAAADRARRVSDPTTAPANVCQALELLGRSHRVQDLDAARECFTSAYRTADEAGLPIWRLRALHELGTVELFDHAGTDALSRSRDTAEHLGAHSTAAMLDVQLAAAYHLRFDLDAAETHASRARQQAEQLGLPGLTAIATFFVAGTHALRGDRSATTAAVADTYRAAPDDPEIDGYVGGGATAMLELLWGDRVAASEALDRAIAVLHGVASSSPGHYRGLWALLHAVEHRADAHECIRQVRESGATVMRANQGYLHYADAVLRHTADTVLAGDADLVHAPLWQHLGRMLVAEAALTDDWGTPDRWLHEARACFESHRLDHLAAHCSRLLGEAPRQTPAGLSVRETEVLDLLASGLANKQIANRLQLSVRTVEKHVENLLRKSGAQSRAQLIAMLGETT